MQQMTKLSQAALAHAEVEPVCVLCPWPVCGLWRMDAICRLWKFCVSVLVDTQSGVTTERSADLSQRSYQPDLLQSETGCDHVRNKCQTAG